MLVVFLLFLSEGMAVVFNISCGNHGSCSGHPQSLCYSIGSGGNDQTMVALPSLIPLYIVAPALHLARCILPGESPPFSRAGRDPLHQPRSSRAGGRSWRSRVWRACGNRFSGVCVWTDATPALSAVQGRHHIERRSYAGFGHEEGAGDVRLIENASSLQVKMLQSKRFDCMNANIHLVRVMLLLEARQASPRSVPHTNASVFLETLQRRQVNETYFGRRKSTRQVKM